jgi:hypothetical protein
MEKNDRKPTIYVSSTNKVLHDSVEQDGKCLVTSKWVKIFSVSQIFLGLQLFILEIVFTTMVHGHHEHSLNWLSYSGFWAGFLLTKAGTVGLFSQRSTSGLKMVTSHMTLNILASVVASSTIIVEALILHTGFRLSAGKLSVIGLKIFLAMAGFIISIVASTSGCRSACCVPYGCCCGVDNYRYYMDQGDGVIEVQVVPRNDKKTVLEMNNNLNNNAMHMENNAL